MPGVETDGQLRLGDDGEVIAPEEPSAYTAVRTDLPKDPEISMQEEVPEDPAETKD